MEYKAFREDIKAAAEKLLNGGGSVSFRSYAESDGVDDEAIRIKVNGQQYVPDINMNSLYQTFLENNYSMEELAENLVKFTNLYQNNNGLLGDGINIDQLWDWESMRSRIHIGLLNRDANEAVLGSLPFVPFLDMAAAFFVNVGSQDDIIAVIRINNDLFDAWDVDVDELFESGLQNMREQSDFKIKYISGMDDAITVRALVEEYPEELRAERGGTRDISGVEVKSGLPFDDEELKMYPVFDKSMRNGSAVMLFPDVLRGFSDKIGGDLIILPSSVNEVILIRDMKDENVYKNLKEIVKGVNDSIVHKSEVLSYSIYRYSRDDNAVGVVM